jgi:hypothetical protein
VDKALDIFQISGGIDGADVMRGWFGHKLFERASPH